MLLCGGERLLDDDAMHGGRMSVGLPVLRDLNPVGRVSVLAVCWQCACWRQTGQAARNPNPGNGLRWTELKPDPWSVLDDSKERERRKNLSRRTGRMHLTLYFCCPLGVHTGEGSIGVGLAGPPSVLRTFPCSAFSLFSLFSPSCFFLAAYVSTRQGGGASMHNACRREEAVTTRLAVPGRCWWAANGGLPRAREGGSLRAVIGRQRIALLLGIPPFRELASRDIVSDTAVSGELEKVLRAIRYRGPGRGRGKGPMAKR